MKQLFHRILFVLVFITYLFNDTVHSWDYIALNDRMIMNIDLERMWKEAVVAWFEVLCRHLPGGTEENHQNFQSE
jgi:hypothetical protein